MPARRRIGVFGVVGIASMAGALVTFGQGGPEGVAPGPQLPTEIIGAKFCVDCHQEPGNRKPQVEKGTYLCRLVESSIFQESDRHRDAMKVLTDPRAKRMGALLYKDEDVTRQAACVSCHGVTIPSDARVDPSYEVVADGVTCVACHGTSGYWVTEHQFPERPVREPKYRGKTWRDLTRVQKQEDFGMVDLWDPVARAGKCASCHVGNAGEGKLITHAMYAAGHPPLPGLEAATFSDEQPRHWQYLWEKKPQVRARLGVSDRDDIEYEQAELVAVGGIVELRESLRLFVAEAKGQVEGQKPPWPDYARFDCAACHHELQSPSWRQARGFAHAPGRPLAPRWPTVLVRLGIEAADPGMFAAQAALFDARVDALQSAFAARPFCDTTRAISAAEAMTQWVDPIIADLREAEFDRATALLLLRRLCRMAATETPDYDSARQIAWAFRTIYGELKNRNPRLVPDADIAKILKDLDEALVLTLHPGKKVEPIEAELGRRLEAVAGFNPASFKAHFSALESLLPPGDAVARDVGRDGAARSAPGRR